MAHARVVTALLLALLPAAARAGYEHPDARNAGVDANPYRLDPAGLGVLSTGTGRVLGRFDLAGGLAFQQVSRPIVIDDAGGDLLRALVDDRSQFDLGLALGLGRGVEVGLTLPVVLRQDAELPGMKLGDVAPRGVGDLGLRARLGLYDGRRGALALALPVVVPTGDADAWMGTGLPAAEPTLQASVELGPIALCSALGYRVQGRSTLDSVVDGHKLLGRAGLGFQLPDARWSAETEAWISTRAGAPFVTPGETAAEALVGGSWRPKVGLRAGAAAGAGLAPGVGAPAWRGLITVGWSGATRPDPDHDGVPLPRDRCPAGVEDWDGFRDDDGCADEDDDGDGIADGADACPAQAEDPDGHRDDDGCPEPDPPPTPEVPSADAVAAAEEPIPETPPAAAAETPIPETPPPPVTFAFGTTEPDAAGCEALARILELLRADPGLALVVEGHTDDVGSSEVNLRISEARAVAVLAWLVREGGADLASRLTARGFGEDRPRAPNTDEAGRALNRRVELVPTAVR